MPNTTYPPAPALHKRGCTFLPIALAGQSWRFELHLKTVQPRQAHPWQSCCDSCPGFHFQPVTLRCYGCLARRSKTEVPLPPRNQLGQSWATRRSSSCARFASRLRPVSRSCGPGGPVQRGDARRCDLPIFCHQSATVIMKETTQM